MAISGTFESNDCCVLGRTLRRKEFSPGFPMDDELDCGLSGEFVFNCGSSFLSTFGLAPPTNRVVSLKLVWDVLLGEINFLIEALSKNSEK
mmetsp:Transcript_22582/g.53317  ORF Transcript_22582/g.53317 Transcript_22582/m.53317 type:complete len:91 (+) Transcript_22582:265-537(+)